MNYTIVKLGSNQKIVNAEQYSYLVSIMETSRRMVKGQECPEYAAECGGYYKLAIEHSEAVRYYEEWLSNPKNKSEKQQ